MTISGWMALLPGVVVGQIPIAEAMLAPFLIQQGWPVPWSVFLVGFIAVGIFQAWFYAHRSAFEAAFKRGVAMHAGVVYVGSVWFTWPAHDSWILSSPYGLGFWALLWGGLGILTAAYLPLALSNKFPGAIREWFLSNPRPLWFASVIVVLLGTLALATAIAAIANLWHPGFH